LLGAALASLTIAVAAAQPLKRVLILHSFGPEFNEYPAKALRTELDRQLPERVDFYESWLISARFTATQEDPAFANYLHSVFAERPLDLIVTFGASAANFVQRHRKSLFPAVPALLGDVEERRVPSSGFTGNEAAVAISVNFPAIAHHILRILPQTNNLAIVIGNSPIEKYWGSEIKSSLQPFENRLTLTWLNEMPFDEVLKRVASLPPRSAILYVLLSPEVPGIPPDGEWALAKLHAAANAPMFSYTDAYLGKGIVGGPLISSEEQARQTAGLAVRILAGERPANLRIAPIAAGTPQYDVRELRRWNISDSDLPRGSIVRFREPGALERYRWQIAGIGMLLLLETALLVKLLHEHRRRRRAEIEAHQRIAELAHMNRRATVGQLSGAIAHELNQPLGAILRNTEAAELILDSPTPQFEELRAILIDIKQDDQRAGEVIRRLRRLLAKAPFEPQEIDLNAMLSEVFEFLSAQATARGVMLSTSLAVQSPRVSGDRIQLQQVILNLVMNGMDAISAAEIAQRNIIGRTRVIDSTLIEVSIEDSGPGIPVDKMERIFEPFFTTKDSGMGMGLSIARAIVESHGGRIWAENAAGGGALFRFTLLSSVASDRVPLLRSARAAASTAISSQIGEARAGTSCP
jgi:signal transduction histidine kinase